MRRILGSPSVEERQARALETLAESMQHLGHVVGILVDRVETLFRAIEIMAEENKDVQ